eukprot:17831-Heterococcus_DN1.PRE.2
MAQSTAQKLLHIECLDKDCNTAPVRDKCGLTMPVQQYAVCSSKYLKPDHADISTQSHLPHAVCVKVQLVFYKVYEVLLYIHCFLETRRQLLAVAAAVTCTAQQLSHCSKQQSVGSGFDDHESVPAHLARGSSVDSACMSQAQSCSVDALHQHRRHQTLRMLTARMLRVYHSRQCQLSQHICSHYVHQGHFELCSIGAVAELSVTGAALRHNDSDYLSSCCTVCTELATCTRWQYHCARALQCALNALRHCSPTSVDHSSSSACIGASS